MRKIVLLVAAVSATLVMRPAYAQRTELKADLIAQQTPVWCWAATASMALELLGFPDIDPSRNYQCGVVAAAFPGCEDDCTQCVTRLGPLTNLVAVLDRYQDLTFERDGQTSAQTLSPNYVPNPQWKRIKQSLDLAYPVIAGISPDGRPNNPAQSQHAILITGYDDNYRGTGEQWVILRDPYPYAPRENPYVSAGYRFQAASGKAKLPWKVLRDRLNLTSAVFLEKQSA